MYKYQKVSIENRLSEIENYEGKKILSYLIAPTTHKFLCSKNINVNLYLELVLRSYWGNKTYANKTWHCDEPYRYIYEKNILNDRKNIMKLIKINSVNTFKSQFRNLIKENMLKETYDSKGRKAYLLVAHENLTEEDFKNLAENYKTSRIENLEEKQDKNHKLIVEYGDKSTNNNVDEMNNQARYIVLPHKLYAYITRTLTYKQCKLYLKIRAYTLHSKNKYYQKSLNNICLDIGVNTGKQMRSQVSEDLKQLYALSLIDLSLVTYTTKNNIKTRIFRAKTKFSDKLPSEKDLIKINIDTLEEITDEEIEDKDLM